MNFQIIQTLLALVVVAYLIGRFFGIRIIPFGLALSEDVDVPSREGRSFSYPVLAAVKVYNGALIVLDSSGWAKPGVTGTGLVAAGVSDVQIDNTDGQNGDVSVTVKRGVFRFKNSADADLITKAQIGDACFIVDDATVAKTNGGGNRSVAGEIVDVDDDGVWVDIPSAKISTAGDLVAANNLSDVANAGTARSNIGANLLALELDVANLVGSAASVYRVVSPVAGVITKIKSVLEGHALATGDATLTGRVGANAITDGAITITEQGSAIGDVDTASPSAARTVVEGSVISITVGGTNDNAAATAKVTILVAY